MSSDTALALIVELLMTTMFVAGPVLGAALIGGVIVGVIQTATQINEASIAYVVKVGAVLLLLTFAGPTLAEKTVTYAKHSIGSIETVVR